jgi:hypothetical protein
VWEAKHRAGNRGGNAESVVAGKERRDRPPRGHVARGGNERRGTIRIVEYADIAVDLAPGVQLPLVGCTRQQHRLDAEPSEPLTERDNSPQSLVRDHECHRAHATPVPSTSARSRRSVRGTMFGA